MERTEAAMVSTTFSSLTELLLYMRQAVEKIKGNDLLMIPLGLANHFLSSSIPLDSAGLSDLVRLFDGVNRGNCSRLDVVSFHCMLHVLLRVGPCMARDRGLYLFLDSMKQLTNATQKAGQYTAVLASRQRKSLLCKKMCQCFLQIFVGDNNDRPRRWSGQFLLELIRNSKDNKVLLAMGPEDARRKLGAVVLYERDYTLRFIAGAIIRDMLAAGFDRDIFWIPDASSGAIVDFPSGNLTDSEWMKTYERFINRADSGLGMNEFCSPTILQFIRSCNVPGLVGHQRGSTIGVVILDSLTIFIAGDNQFQFADVPFDCIRAVKVSQATFPVVNVELHSHGYCNTNGLMVRASGISMVLDEMFQAIKMSKAMEHGKDRSQLRPTPIAADRNVLSVGSFAVNGASFTHTTKNQEHTSSARLALGEFSALDNPISSRFNDGRPSSRNPQSRRIQRHLSCATIKLPTGEEVAAQSNAYRCKKLEKENKEICSQAPDCCNVDHRQTVKNVESSEVGNFTASINVGDKGSQVRSQTPNEIAIRANVVPNSGSQRDKSRSATAVLANSKTTLEGQIILSSPERAKHDVPVGLQVGHHRNAQSSLRSWTGALDLQHPDIHHQIAIQANMTKPLESDQDPTVDVGLPNAMKSAIDIEETSNLQGKQASAGEVEQVDDIQHSGPGSAKSYKIHGDKGPDGPAEIKCNSRLKRPHHRICGITSNKSKVDWDQDLRVCDNEDKMPFRKKPKKTPQPKTIAKGVSTKKVSRSAQNRQPRSIPLTPITGPAAEKGRRKRLNRQVTKTLASARQRRAAAVKAEKKLALASEYEHAAFDIDDPIESSSPPESIHGQSKQELGTAVQQSAMTPVQDMVVVRTARVSQDLQQSPVSCKDALRMLTAKRSEPASLRQGIIDAKRDETSPETPPLRLFTTRQGKGDVQGTGNTEIITVSSKDPSVNEIIALENAGHSVSTDKLESGEAMPAKKSTSHTGIKQQSLGERLAQVLTGAGILPPILINTDEEVNNDIASATADSREGQPSIARDMVSRVSKSVSQFMLRQAAAGRQTSAMQRDQPYPQLQTMKANPAVPEPSRKVANLPPPANSVSQEEILSVGQTELLTTDGGHAYESTGLPSILKCKPKEEGSRKAFRGSQHSSSSPVDKQFHNKVQTVSSEPNSCWDRGARSTLLACQTPRNRFPTREESKAPTHLKTYGAMVENKEGGIGTSEDDDDFGDSTSLTPTPKRSKPSTAAGSGSCDSVRIDSSSTSGATRAEFLWKKGPVHFFNSQGSKVDENGSPKPIYMTGGRIGVATNPHRAGFHRGVLDDPKTESNLAVVRRQNPSIRTYHGIARQNKTEAPDADTASWSDVDMTEDDTDYCSTESPLWHRCARQENHVVGVLPTSPEIDKTTPLQQKPGRYTASRKTLPYSVFAENCVRKKGSKQNIIKNPMQSCPATAFAEHRTASLFKLDQPKDDSGFPETNSWETTPSSRSVSSGSSVENVEGKGDVHSEWQTALRSTQKTALDILLDTSSRLVRHLVDEETAIASIVKTYKNGCDKLIDQLQDVHESNFREYENRLQAIQHGVVECFKAGLARLRDESDKLGKLPSAQELNVAISKRRRLLDQLDDALKEYEVQGAKT